MLGLKTKLLTTTKRIFAIITPFLKEGRPTAGGFFRFKLSNDISIRQLMQHFHADEYGHRCSVKQADLGYGWIHYGFIRHLKPQRILCIGSRHGYIPAVLAQACKDNSYGHVDFVDAGYGQDDENHWTGEAYWKTTKGQSAFKNFGLQKHLTLHIMTTEEFVIKLKSSPPFSKGEQASRAGQRPTSGKPRGFKRTRKQIKSQDQKKVGSKIRGNLPAGRQGSLQIRINPSQTKRKSKHNHQQFYDYIYIDGDHSYKGVKKDYKLLWPLLKPNGFMSFHDVSITTPKPEGIYGVHKLWQQIAKKNAIIFPFKGSGLGLIQKT